jgi:hypothetical protein
MHIHTQQNVYSQITPFARPRRQPRPRCRRHAAPRATDDAALAHWQVAFVLQGPPPSPRLYLYDFFLSVFSFQSFWFSSAFVTFMFLSFSPSWFLLLFLLLLQIHDLKKKICHWFSSDENAAPGSDDGGPDVGGSWLDRLYTRLMQKDQNREKAARP